MNLNFFDFDAFRKGARDATEEEQADQREADDKLERDVRYKDLLAELEHKRKTRPLQLQKLIDDGITSGVNAKYASRKGELGMDVLEAQAPAQVNQSRLAGATAAGQMENLGESLALAAQTTQYNQNKLSVDSDLLDVEGAARRSNAGAQVIANTADNARNRNYTAAAPDIAALDAKKRELQSAQTEADLDFLPTGQQVRKSNASATLLGNQVANDTNQDLLDSADDRQAIGAQQRELERLNNEGELGRMDRLQKLKDRQVMTDRLKVELQSAQTVEELALVKRKAKEAGLGIDARIAGYETALAVEPSKREAAIAKATREVSESEDAEVVRNHLVTAGQAKADIANPVLIKRLAAQHNTSPAVIRAGMVRKMDTELAQAAILSGQAATAQRMGILSKESNQFLAKQRGRGSKNTGKESEAETAGPKEPVGHKSYSRTLTNAHMKGMRSLSEEKLQAVATDVKADVNKRYAAQTLLFTVYGVGNDKE